MTTEPGRTQVSPCEGLTHHLVHRQTDEWLVLCRKHTEEKVNDDRLAWTVYAMSKPGDVCAWATPGKAEFPMPEGRTEECPTCHAAPGEPCENPPGWEGAGLGAIVDGEHLARRTSRQEADRD